MRISLLSLLIACCAGCGGYRENEFNSFTQCIRPLEVPPESVGMLYRNTERSCYGQRWRFPTAIRASMHIAYEPIAEALFVEVEDSAAAWMQQHGVAHFVPPVDYRRFQIRPAFEAPCERMARSLRVYMDAMHMRDAEPRFGLNVRHRLEPDGSEDALFYPAAGKNYFALCRPTVLVDGRRAIEKALCEVHAAIDTHFDLKYLVAYAELARLDEINVLMMDWIEGFKASDQGNDK